MTKRELIENLNNYLNKPQPSERFAMYRLITPVVDFANSTMELEVYFEFKQTSLHLKTQSADIALLTAEPNATPQIIIEAKRLNRKISNEDGSKYLQEMTRSIVTDGENWILTLNGKNKNINLLNQDKEVSDYALDEVISFIRNEPFNTGTGTWTTNNISYKSTTKPKHLGKEKKAVHAKHQISKIETADDLNHFIKSNEKITELENSFLLSFFSQLNKVGLKSIICKSRKTRISFFSKGNNKRIGRIELGNKNPDILILTKIVEYDNSIENIAKSFVHDKGSHMRRFRLHEKKQSIKFGKKMIDLISKYKDL